MAIQPGNPGQPATVRFSFCTSGCAPVSSYRLSVTETIIETSKRVVFDGRVRARSGHYARAAAECEGCGVIAFVMYPRESLDARRLLVGTKIVDLWQFACVSARVSWRKVFFCGRNGSCVFACSCCDVMGKTPTWDLTHLLPKAWLFVCCIYIVWSHMRSSGTENCLYDVTHFKHTRIDV